MVMSLVLLLAVRSSAAPGVLAFILIGDAR
jgi:hypothetical protein